MRRMERLEKRDLLAIDVLDMVENPVTAYERQSFFEDSSGTEQAIFHSENEFFVRQVVTDGTKDGTRFYRTQATEPPTIVGDNLFIFHSDGAPENRPVVSVIRDGTKQDLVTGEIEDSLFGGVMGAKTKVFFRNESGSWVSDGTMEGTINIEGISATERIDTFGDNLLYRNRFDNELWVTDGVTSKPLMPRYSLMREIENPMPSSGDAFGRSVSASGDRFAITAPYDDAAGEDAGTVYLFDGNGNLLQTFLNPTGRSSDLFGADDFSVAIVGDFVVVTSVVDDTKARDAGAAYVFDSSGGLVHSIFDPAPGVDDKFGKSIAPVGDDKFVIGAHRDKNWVGTAFLFDVDGNLVKEIDNPNPAHLDLFGRNVGPFGEFVMVGADSDSSLSPGSAAAEGAAYLYDQEGNLLQSFAPPTQDTGRVFGRASAGFEDRVIIADEVDNSGASQSGAVHLFDISGNYLRTILNPTPGVDDFFGHSLAWVNGNILVGAPFDDTVGEDAGAAYLFNTDGDLLQTFLDPASKAGSQFGSSVASVDGKILITADGDSGTAYLFTPNTHETDYTVLEDHIVFRHEGDLTNWNGDFLSNYYRIVSELDNQIVFLKENELWATDGSVEGTTRLTEASQQMAGAQGETTTFLVASDSGGLNAVLQYDQEGNHLSDFIPTGSGGFHRGSSNVFGPDGNFYSITGGRRGGILRFDGQDGTFIDEFVSKGSERISFLHGLDFGPDGNLYVTTDSQILRYSGTTGEFIDVFATGSGTIGQIIFGPDGNLYKGIYHEDKVLRFNGTTGQFMDEFISRGSGGLDGPAELSFERDGKFYAVSRLNNSVLRYSETGEFLDTFISTPDETMYLPEQFEFGPDGNAYVSGRNSNNVVRFDGQTGEFIDEFIDVPLPTYIEFIESTNATIKTAIDFEQFSLEGELPPPINGVRFFDVKLAIPGSPQVAFHGDNSVAGNPNGGPDDASTGNSIVSTSGTLTNDRKVLTDVSTIMFDFPVFDVGLDVLDIETNENGDFEIFTMRAFDSLEGGEALGELTIDGSQVGLGGDGNPIALDFVDLENIRRLEFQVEINYAQPATRVPNNLGFAVDNIRFSSTLIADEIHSLDDAAIIHAGISLLAVNEDGSFATKELNGAACKSSTAPVASGAFFAFSTINGEACEANLFHYDKENGITGPLLTTNDIQSLEDLGGIANISARVSADADYVDWISHGTVDQTYPSEVGKLSGVVWNDYVYFSRRAELWRANGIATETRLVIDFQEPNQEDIFAPGVTIQGVVNDRLLISLRDFSGDSSLISLHGNLPPTPIDDSVNILADRIPPIDGNLLTNDSDPGDDVLELTSVTGSNNYGFLTWQPDGSFNYKLVRDQALSDLKVGEELVENYDYVITDEDGASSTATLSIIIEGTKWQTPANVQASDGDFEGGILVSWDAIPGATTYELYRGNSAHDISELVAVGIIDTQFIDATAERGNVHYYAIKAIGAAGTRGLSDSDIGISLLDVSELDFGLGLNVIYDQTTGDVFFQSDSPLSELVLFADGQSILDNRWAAATNFEVFRGLLEPGSSELSLRIGGRFANGWEISQAQLVNVTDISQAAVLAYRESSGELVLSSRAFLTTFELQSESSSFIGEAPEFIDGDFNVFSASKIFEIEPSGFTKLDFGPVISPSLTLDQLRSDFLIHGSIRNGGTPTTSFAKMKDMDVQKITRLPGDFDGSGTIGAEDIDALCGQIRTGGFQAAFDLDGNGELSLNDFDYMIREILGTTVGDANLDGVFDSADLVSVFAANQFEDGVEDNSGWASGDWNCDQEFDTSDLIRAFQGGSYSSNTVAAALLGIDDE